MMISFDIQPSQAFGQRAETNTVGTVFPDLVEHGSPRPPLVVIHSRSLALGKRAPHPPLTGVPLACPRDAPERPSTANDHRYPQSVNPAQIPALT